MKMQSLKLLAAAFVLGIFTVLASANTASAQEVLSFKVPFEFSVGGKKMEAGNYDLKKMSHSRFVLRNAETKESMIIVSDGDTANGGAATGETLVFNRYGNAYFLRRIYANRNQPGREIYESKKERLVRKGENETQLAKNQANPEQVSVKSAQ